MSRSRKSVKLHVRRKSAKHHIKPKHHVSKRAKKQGRKSVNRRRRASRLRSGSRKYLGLVEGQDKFLTLDENVSRARNIGWSNWSGNAEEENAIRKELNKQFLKPRIGNTKDDEAEVDAEELAYLQAEREKSKNKQSVVDDTEDIEDDIFYSEIPDVYSAFKHPTPALKEDPKLLEQLKKTKYFKDNKVDVDAFFKEIATESDASSFFSTKKPRGSLTRGSELAKRGVVVGAKAVGSAIASGAMALASALGDGCPAGSSIDYDYTLLNPIAQKEKNCYSNCDLMEVNDGVYCMPSKTSRFEAKSKGQNNPDPSKYKAVDPVTGEPRRLRKLVKRREEKQEEPKE